MLEFQGPTPQPKPNVDVAVPTVIKPSKFPEPPPPDTEPLAFDVCCTAYELVLTIDLTSNSLFMSRPPTVEKLLNITKSPITKPCPLSVTVTVEEPEVVVKGLVKDILILRKGVMSEKTPSE